MSNTRPSLPTSSGRCGPEVGNTPCLTYEGTGIRQCCNVNGYCGITDEYCLAKNNCQYDCIDPSSFLSTPSPTSSPTSPPAPSSNSTATTLSTVASNTPSPSATAAASSGLRRSTRIGIGVGASIGGILLILIIILIAKRTCFKKPPPRQRAVPPPTVEIPRRTNYQANPASSSRPVVTDE